jgi:3-oxoacyl-[acyl-carrier protein] reductase
LGELPPEDFHYQLHLNVLGVYEHTRVAQKHMKAGGRILIISSILGERGIGPGMWSYNASKFAATGFGRSIAHDLGERNITVNIIQPGPIDTDLNPASESSGMEQMTALKRYGKPEEVAALASFLASEESSYITGATINVDGGMNA